MTSPRLGPLQLQMSRRQDVGEACLDLTRRALPFCSRKSHEVFESPVLLVPLSHVRGGIVADAGLGEAVATVAVAVMVDMDPESILSKVEARIDPADPRVGREASTLPLAGLAQRAEGFIRAAYEAPGWFTAPEAEATEGLRTMTPDDTVAASRRADQRQVPASKKILQAPDLSPEGGGEA